MKRFLLGVPFLALSFGVLSVSLVSSSTPGYSYLTPPTPTVLQQNTDNAEEKGLVEYKLPLPGSVHPGSLLWPIEAIRDRVLYLVTTSPLERAKLALSFADRRLIYSCDLFEDNNPGVGVSTLSKGEKYFGVVMENVTLARKEGVDTSKFLETVAQSSLKHREIIEKEILPMAPDLGKPEVVKAADDAKNAYNSSRDILNSEGKKPPNNPFDSH